MKNRNLAKELWLAAYSAQRAFNSLDYYEPSGRSYLARCKSKKLAAALAYVYTRDSMADYRPGRITYNLAVKRRDERIGRPNWDSTPNCRCVATPIIIKRTEDL